MYAHQLNIYATAEICIFSLKYAYTAVAVNIAGDNSDDPNFKMGHPNANNRHFRSQNYIIK